MSRTVTSLPLLAAAVLAGAVGLAPAAAAQTAAVDYDLVNVWLDPDITHPWEGPRQLTGRFTWTYTVGDFENGAGVFTHLDVPWLPTNPPPLITTIDLGSIEISMSGNWHGLGADVQLFLLNDLDPNQTSAVDLARSAFEIENGVVRKGHVISGSIVPDFQMSLVVAGTCPTHQFQLSGVTANGTAALLYAFGMGGFTIPNGYPCAGTMLGLDGTTALGATVTADAAGDAVLVQTVPAGACSRVYLQALDLGSCGLSPAVLLG